MSETVPDENLTGFLLYTKPAGVTSFSSLLPIKHALGKKKAGHTGTLDSFAEGLLVTLTGRATHLTPYITALPKTYLAVVCFGRATDTLDPTGAVVKTGPAPLKEDILKILPSFKGKIIQAPPAYSALHVKGKRASDVVRCGGKVSLPAREVTIYSLELLDFEGGGETSSALFEVSCSKGTYIRSLARDIAEKAGTCGCVTALRRTKVGPFSVENAAGASRLRDFSVRGAVESRRAADNHEGGAPSTEEIRDHFRLFTKDIAAGCGLPPVVIREGYESYFANGKRLYPHVFSRAPTTDGAFAAFYGDDSFAGVVKARGGFLSYDFTIPPAKRDFRVFSWDDIMNGAFPLYMRARGTALTVGSFEALHKGHAVLINETASQKQLSRGILTFRGPIKRGETPIFTLNQRLTLFRGAGLDFAVTIDFTDDFASMSGEEFLSVLIKKLGMRQLIEGEDFRAGGGGGCDMEAIEAISRRLKFTLVREKTLFENGRKISSSRVRECVADGRTAEATALLGRPFALDTKGAPCTIRDGAVVFDFRGRQILPQNGTYSVRVVSDSGSADGVQAASQNGFLELKTDIVSPSITSIEF